MGLRKSVFGVASGLVGLLRTRLELLALEAADEKARLLKLLGMAFAALLFLTLAVLVFTVSIAVAFWPTENRYLALGLLAGLYAVLGVGLLVAVRQALLYGPPPFSATLEELGRDAELLERVRDAQDEDPRRRGGLSHDRCSPSIDRAVRIESCCARAAIERESWPRASPAPAASWSRPRSSRACCPGWHRAMRHAGPCRPSAWRAVIHWSARRCPPCSCGAASAFAC